VGVAHAQQLHGGRVGEDLYQVCCTHINRGVNIDRLTGLSQGKATQLCRPEQLFKSCFPQGTRVIHK
jgi:hypothetical protein